MEPTPPPAHRLLEDMARGDLSAADLTRSALGEISRRDPELRAFLHVDAAAAMEQAEAVDARRRRGEPLGPLAGLPVALKDNLCARNTPTTAGSRILETYRPPFDATVVERLRAADAVIIGKTNLDEFGMGSSCENSAYAVTRNPHDPARTPGGSSGGSACAVAAGMCALSLGSDTGGSVRQPASFCGVVGLKPSYGRVSRFGLIAYGSSLDQIGPIARDVRDAALLLEVIAGRDPRDATSVDAPVPAYHRTLEAPVESLTIGVPREFFGGGLDAEVEAAVREALRAYERRGARLVEVTLPHASLALAAYYVVATAEASSNLARYDGVHFGRRAEAAGGLVEMMSRSRAEGFGDEVKRRILLGTYTLSSGYRDAYYLTALKVRRLIRNDYDAAFSHCDVIAGPTAPTPAFRLGEKADPLSMYLADVYTVSANLAGLAAVSVPCGRTRGGLPIGLQLQAGPLEEEKLLRAARTYEQATGGG